MSAYGNKLINGLSSLFLIVSISATACASGEVAKDPGGGAQVINQTVKTGDRFEELLVDIRSYSTNGAFYQKKYHRDILSIARDITEKEDIDISKGSVGFYYDKKSERRDRLFFGFDIIVKKDNDLDYGRFAVKLIKQNVSGIIDEIYKYRFVPSEEEVVGVVIGFRWTEDNRNQQVNIWIKKDDISLFQEDRITVNEMYQRGTVTNTNGRVILLPI